MPEEFVQNPTDPRFETALNKVEELVLRQPQPKLTRVEWLKRVEAWYEMDATEATASFKEETGLHIKKVPADIRRNAQKFADWLEVKVLA